jgi:hypothetical protein
MLVNRFGYDIRPVASGGGRGGGRGRGDGGPGGRGEAAAAASATPAPPPPIEPRRVWDVNGRSEARGTEFASATRNHVRNFLDCVKSRQKPVCDVDAGFAASLPCLLANVAIQQERTVKWDGNKAT